jgi:hypothetical protein
VTPRDLVPDLAEGDENRRSSDDVLVVVPDELPVLTPGAARVLLGILVELTTVEVLDGPVEGASCGG